MDLTQFFEELWKQYTIKTPSAQKIRSLFETEGNTVFNDHIAIRTFNDPRVSIDVLARPFIAMGYEFKEEYYFKAKKLYAKHFEHKSNVNAPKIFISELILEEFSLELNRDIQNILNETDQKKFQEENLILKGRVWDKPSYEIYKKLLVASEYAAWVYVNGFCSNHFTVDVNKLQTFKDLSQVNEFLKKNGFKMNTSGGEIKGSPSQLLEQSSILADVVEVEFEENVKQITSCYYEFSYRHKNDQDAIFNGFIADSADKIFESTDMQLQSN
ncbi:uncharacterized protein DUF1338 [Aquimarina sp. MAR_2010_214]|uniref:DUF1338 domain-containing protein n=1 Tax=Aquimarina sp. MAR_2010_214 TaxID=1250026 RepID=UPI000C701549|nr:DUF1338 domain-containing protein [Aquimarina sp. MAR_2010_214]PKV51190.1 uncharacterized protein DUF1338 [Aquimarina sp. MAR_2010_214]